MAQQLCEHLDKLVLMETDKYDCEECIKINSSWVHLRLCQTCGAVLCCNSSPNQHALKHFKESGHPVISSAEPGEFWAYCFPDDIMKNTSS